MTTPARRRWLEIQAEEGETKAMVDDPINPDYYKSHSSGIECIEITRHFNFNRGNAIKYIWRAGVKGDAVEDLLKAIWYLQDEISRIG